MQPTWKTRRGEGWLQPQSEAIWRHLHVAEPYLWCHLEHMHRLWGVDISSPHISEHTPPDEYLNNDWIGLWLGSFRDLHSSYLYTFSLWYLDSYCCMLKSCRWWDHSGCLSCTDMWCSANTPGVPASHTTWSETWWNVVFSLPIERGNNVWFCGCVCVFTLERVSMNRMHYTKTVYWENNQRNSWLLMGGFASIQYKFYNFGL